MANTPIHILYLRASGEQICKAYKQIIQDSVQEIRFSYNKYHLTKINRPNGYYKAFFKLGIYSHLDNTSKETKGFTRGKSSFSPKYSPLAQVTG